MGRSEEYKQVNTTLGTSWDLAKELADKTPLTASGFVRELVKRYGEILVADINCRTEKHNTKIEARSRSKLNERNEIMTNQKTKTEANAVADKVDSVVRLKQNVSAVLQETLSGMDAWGDKTRFRDDNGFVRWGLVEKEIYKFIDEANDSMRVSE